MRPFCIAAIATVLGIIMGLYLKSIALFVLFSLLIIILFLKTKKSYHLIFLACFFAFYSYITILENQYEKVCQNFDNQEVKIQAIVISNPKQKEYKQTYEIQVLKMENLSNQNQTTKPFKMLCNIKNSKQHLQYGDKIELVTIYEVPEVARNEGRL